MSFRIKKNKNIIFGEFSEFTKQNVTTAVSFRQGGKSLSPFDSLNLGLHTNDNRRNVLENRRLFFELLSINYKNIVTLKQIHSNRVEIVDKSDKGKGALNFSDSLSEADGMVTNGPGVPLAVFTADCMSIFFMDPQKRIIGIAHAGWKGTLLKITTNVINAMKRVGAELENIIIGFGPAIGNCCYEIKKDLIERFSNKYIETKNKKCYLNLRKANMDILISSGIRKDNIIDSNFCTFCHSDYCFSYRKEKQTGRMASVIMLQE